MQWACVGICHHGTCQSHDQRARAVICEEMSNGNIWKKEERTVMKMVMRRREHQPREKEEEEEDGKEEEGDGNPV